MSPPRLAAGLLLYRRGHTGFEVLLVHPGGPYWSKKDLGAWTIPKGEPEAGETALQCAQREFWEETGLRPPGPFQVLGEVRQSGGKRVRAWAVEGDADPESLRSDVFEMEWPPRSGRTSSFPEVDRYGWFAFDEARRRINSAQVELIDRLEALLR